MRSGNTSLLRRCVITGVVMAGAHALVLEPVADASHRAGHDTVRTSPERLRQKYWKASQLLNVRGPARFERLGFMRIYVQLMRENPGMDRREARQQIARVRREYEKARAPLAESNDELDRIDENLMRFFNIVKSVQLSHPAAAPAKAAVEEAVKWWMAEEKRARDTEAAEWSQNASLEQGSRAFTGIAWTRAEDAIYDDVLRLSRAADGDETEAGLAFDTIFGAEGGSSVYASLDELLRDPTLASLHITETIDETTQAIRASQTEVLGAVEKGFTDARRLEEEELARLEEIDTRVGDLQDQLQALIDAQASEAAIREARERLQAAREAAAAEARAREQEIQDALDLAKAEVYLVSSILKPFDAELAKGVETVGNATITVVESVIALTEAISAKGALGALASTGGAIATGNIIGAVMNVAGLFIDQGPTPEELILEQVAALQDQVKELGESMHERFDRIDAALNTIFETLVFEFDRIDTRLGEIEGDLRLLQETLFTVQRQLLRFERSLYAILADEARRSFLLETDRALRLRRRAGKNYKLDYDRYLDHESVFFFWARTFAFSPVAVGPPDRSTAPDDLEDQLSAWPLDSNVDYLSAVARSLGVETVAGARSTPSVRDWVMGAQAYADLAQEWKAHARRVNPARLDFLIRIGRQIERNLGGFTFQKTTSFELVPLDAPPLDQIARPPQLIPFPGRPGLPPYAIFAVKTNRPLYRAAVANYRTHAETLDGALQQVETDYLDREGLGIDLWGGARQTAGTVLPDASEMPGCGGARRLAGLGAPLVEELVPVPFRVAQHLELGRVGLCFEGRWTNTRPRILGDGRVEQTLGRLQVRVRSRYGDVDPADIRVRTFTGTEEVICSRQRAGSPCPSDAFDAELQVQRRWPTGLRATFEARSEFTDTDREAAVVEAVDKALAAHQKALYADVVAALDSHLNAAAGRLTGARRMIESLIATGVPRLLERDDELRGFLGGAARLLSGPGVRNAYARAAAAPPPANVRTEIAGKSSGRSRRLDVRLLTGLRSIDRDRYAEYHTRVRTTLDRLELIRFELFGAR